MFAIRGIDHIVLAVADVERSLAFYHGILGLSVEREAEWRAGRVGFPSVRVDDRFIIDLFQRPTDAPPAGPGQHNLNHFCLVTDEADLAAVRRDLEARGVEVLRGPVARWGAQGEALSVYLRDPDGNEVEIRSYAPAARQEAERLRAAVR